MTPNTNLKLLDVSINITQQNQIDFNSLSSQYSFFSSCAFYSFSEFTYQRIDGFVRAPINAENIYNCNYVMYQNSNFGSKWFYAFVTRIEYVNANCCNLYLKTDVFQTWLFDFTLNSSFVERETVSNDDYFLHTVPENLETGETVCIDDDITTMSYFGSSDALEFDNNYYCCVVMSESIAWLSAEYPTSDSFMGGVANCGYYYGCGLNDIFNLINKINENGQASSVVSCFAMPKSFVNFTDIGDGVGLLSDGNSWGSRGREFEISVNKDTLNGYKPKNKKLFCYPYNYLQLTNNCGNYQNLKYELFENKDNITVTNYYVANCNPVVITVPLHYNGIVRDINNSIQFSNFPQIPWNCDAFKNWLAVNSSSLIVNTALKMGNIGISAATGNVLGAVAGAGGLLSDATSLYAQSQQPISMKGIPSSNGQLISNTGNVYYRKYTLRREYAEIIDDFFSRYGYKVNVLKMPSFKNRTNWDYLKINNANISGFIPNTHMAELISVFNSGITVWHSPNVFGNYSLENPAK